MQYHAPFDQQALNPNAPFVNGNPGTGVQGSIPDAGGLEYPQREIVNAVAAAGLTPSDADLYQLLRAIRNGQVWTFTDQSTSANTITIAPGVAHTAITKGLPFRIFPAFSNTAPGVILQINALSAQLKRHDGSALAIADIIAGVPFDCVSDGTNFRILGLATSDTLAIVLANGPVGRSQFFLASGTFTVPPNVTSLEVEVIGGGGAGGATNNSTTGGTLIGNNGAGGGAGGYSYARLTGLTPGAAYAVTVGPAGLAAANAAGGNGGTSSFGALCSATGGGGGAFGSLSQAYGGAGGTATGGLENLTGGQGGASGPNTTTVTTSMLLVVYARGGLAPHGYGSIDLCNTGGTGQGYGNGGSAASGGSGLPGGNGAPGLVIVRW